ncbi:hypothetical protein DFH09DRAFT_1427589 [Mycena vulgaris]|nr:hypothetical protein DFH09DRAFT_1427589 [Mycena vulgaris]
MHPALNLQRINELPISVRRYAKLAANGSRADLGRLISLISQLPNPPRRYVGTLPVFFLHLDPTGTPTPDDPTDTEAVALALLALQGLRALGDLPKECGVDLWPRIFAWIACIHLNRERISSEFYPTEAHICGELMMFIGHFSEDRATSGLFHVTVGVRYMVTRAWAVLFDTEHDRDHPVYLALCDFLRLHMKAAIPRNLREILTASDGLWGFALLIKWYITFFVIDRPTQWTIDALHIMDGLLELLADLGDMEDADMRGALVSAGIVSALTKAAYVIAEADIPESAHLLLAIFNILQMLFTSPPSYRAIGEALGAGLLRAIVRCTTMGAEGNEPDTALWHFLSVALPGATVYYSVVVRLEAALLGVTDLVDTPTFRRLPVSRLWQAFHPVAQERIKFLQAFDSRRVGSSSKACDNMACGLIAEKTEFWRCSECQRVYYCSQNCQKLDWVEGGHREACGSIQKFARDHPEYMSRRNVAFMRELLHNDTGPHSLLREGALMAQVSRIQIWPSEVLVTLFRYRGSARTAEGATVAEMRRLDKAGDVNWDEHSARAARSGGRMVLHVMAVQHGDQERLHIFPLRSNTAALQDGLTRLAGEGLAEDPRERVRRMVQSVCDGLMEIHT